jgi:hypothetical protein
VDVVTPVDVMLKVVELVLENVDRVLEASEDAERVDADVDEILVVIVPEEVEPDEVEGEEVEDNELEEVENS